VHGVGRRATVVAKQEQLAAVASVMANEVEKAGHDRASEARVTRGSVAAPATEHVACHRARIGSPMYIYDVEVAGISDE
jgi:hypothetical protein